MVKRLWLVFAASLVSLPAFAQVPPGVTPPVFVTGYPSNPIFTAVGVGIAPQAGTYEDVVVSSATGGGVETRRTAVGSGVQAMGQFSFASAGTQNAAIAGWEDGATDAGRIRFYTRPTGGANQLIRYGVSSTGGWTVGVNDVLLGSVIAPTISSGFGTSPSVPSNNGTFAFTINVGTGGTAQTGVIGFPTATTGWRVNCDDVTTQSSTVFLTKQIATSTTTATIGLFDAAGAAAAWVASNVLVCDAKAY